MNLNSVMNEVNQAAAQVAVSSGQVASGSQLLANGGEEQERTVEMLSGSISQVAEKVRRLAEKAGEVSLQVQMTGTEVVNCDMSMDGTVTRSASGQNIGEKYEVTGYLEKALNGETTISTTEYDNNNELVIRVAAPYEYGVLLGTYNGSVLSDLISDLRIGESGNAFIIDNTGTMFLESNMLFKGNNSPNNIGLTIVGYLYRQGVEKRALGYACAVGLILLLVVMLVNIIQLKITGTFEEGRE